MTRWLAGRLGISLRLADRLVLGTLIVFGILCYAYLAISPHYERAEHEATFLRQCGEAGYDAAHCRFWLTAAGSTNSDAAMQMIVQNAAH